MQSELVASFVASPGLGITVETFEISKSLSLSCATPIYLPRNRERGYATQLERNGPNYDVAGGDVFGM